MLNEKQIIDLFHELNDALIRKGEIAEIGLVGGAVMCLVFRARMATRDVDAIFKPVDVVRKLVASIGERHGLPSDWLNDAAKDYIQGDFRREDFLSLSNLRVWTPEPRYMLAMKCLSARWETNDKDDVIFLIKHLRIKSAKDVFKIISGFYPKRQIPAKTQFFIDELFET